MLYVKCIKVQRMERSVWTRKTEHFMEKISFDWGLKDK